MKGGQVKEIMLCGFYNRFQGKENEFSVLCRLLKEQTLKNASVLYNEDQAQGTLVVVQAVVEEFHRDRGHGYSAWCLFCYRVR